MPHRKLKVENDEWDVWDVRPAVRPHLLVSLENGWLCFQNGQTRKRLHPIPDGWDDASDGELGELFERAQDVAPARKIQGSATPTDAFRTISPFRDNAPDPQRGSSR
jgi:hypothetical protein